MADQEIRLDLIFDNAYKEALNSFWKMAKPHGQVSTLDMDMSLLHVISRTVATIKVDSWSYCKQDNANY